MTQRRTRRGTRTRTRRTARWRPHLLDNLLIAGCVGGGVYLFFRHVLDAPEVFSAVVGFIAFGFTLGAVVPAPRYRSPIVWRHRR